MSMHELSKNTYLLISREVEGMTSVGMDAYEQNWRMGIVPNVPLYYVLYMPAPPEPCVST